MVKALSLSLMLVPLWVFALTGLVTFPAALLLCASKRGKVAPAQDKDAVEGNVTRKDGEKSISGASLEQTPLLPPSHHERNTPGAVGPNPFSSNTSEGVAFEKDAVPQGGGANLLDGLITPNPNKSQIMSFTLPTPSATTSGDGEVDYNFEQDLSSHVLTRMPAKRGRSSSEKRAGSMPRRQSATSAESAQSPAAAHSSVVFEDTFLLENVPSDDRIASSTNDNGGFSEHSRGNQDHGMPRRATSGPAQINAMRRASAPKISKVDTMKTIKSGRLGKDLSFGAFTGNGSNCSSLLLSKNDESATGELDADAWWETTSFSV